MALMIRLRRMGKTNRKTFRLVVMDKRSPRDGKYLEMLGWYNPFEEGEKNLFVKSQRVEFWLKKGAQLSEKAKSLVKRSAPEVIKNLTEKKLLSAIYEIIENYDKYLINAQSLKSKFPKPKGEENAAKRILQIITQESNK